MFIILTDTLIKRIREIINKIKKRNLIIKIRLNLSLSFHKKFQFLLKCL